jgi:hypothetical protein
MDLTGIFAFAAALPVACALGAGVGYGGHILYEKCQNLGVSASCYLDYLKATCQNDGPGPK